MRHPFADPSPFANSNRAGEIPSPSRPEPRACHWAHRRQEATAFLDSQDPDKRRKLIDRLLGFTGDLSQDIYNDRYAALWTLKWADLIRNNSTTLGESGMWALHNWLKESFRTNKPVDEFVRELVTLTEIPSPPFMEKVRGEAYAKMLTAAGLENVATDPEGNVMAIRRGKDPKHPLLAVAAHLDTVFPEGTNVKVKRAGKEVELQVTPAKGM